MNQQAIRARAEAHTRAAATRAADHPQPSAVAEAGDRHEHDDAQHHCQRSLRQIVVARLLGNLRSEIASPNCNHRIGGRRNQRGGDECSPCFGSTSERNRATPGEEDRDRRQSQGSSERWAGNEAQHEITNPDRQEADEELEPQAPLSRHSKQVLPDVLIVDWLDLDVDHVHQDVCRHDDGRTRKQ